ncbi:metal-dependent hydrolase [Priestia koreensis]|uniref:metal-dependent hydrolase n=1 Tax=Priestia koreensis TaxID=284581 RepID=UPI001F597929|nr:metal-dependent hydrolase [Priestia koreensis]UNL83739.1 metal-dependent hydrolase [Priestia koreensis]
MQITYHGHSTIEISTNGKSFIIDPFISGNPQAKTKAEDIQTDAVLLTHAHLDHILDAAPIAKANNAPVVANPELAAYMRFQGAEALEMNIGGKLDLGFATAKMIHAFHSSGIVDEENQTILYGGMPSGFIIEAEGLTILHAGDTGLFGDMKMIGDRHDIDIAFLPIGDNYTMGPEDAAQAAEWFNAKLVIPVHYDTFEAISQDPHAFVSKLEERGLKGQVLEVGQSMEVSR